MVFFIYYKDVFTPLSHFLMLFSLLLLLRFLQVLLTFLIVYLFLFFLFDLFLNNLLLLIFGSSFLIIHEDISVVDEKLTTSSKLSFVFIFLLLLFSLFLEFCFFFDFAVLFPLEENIVSDQWTYIMRWLLDLFSASNLFLSSSILASISTLSS